ncbi:putative ribosomal protein L23 [Elsinoe fawcettii]|nr:putative ribosomal protein L23 [Elsinoe fawcettii]
MASTAIGAPLSPSISQIVKRAPFRLGTKQVFLPSFKITLLNTPKESPYYATFSVPLSLNKLDLRDYLFHAYNLPVLSITSRTHASAIEPDGNPRIERPQRGRLFRPAPTKKMTVRMEKPFVWPRGPGEVELKEAWNKSVYEGAKQASKDFGAYRRKRDTYVDWKDREELRVQAKRLREGREMWRPPRGKGDGSWAVKVEE